MNDYRILVVDDEEDLCEILKFNLENEGYFVDTANSAKWVNLIPISDIFFKSRSHWEESHCSG